MMPRLRATVGEPESRFDVVSPYFVPMASGTEAFAELARRGVQVRVLTNSLSATDVAAVHAGYAKRRKALLRGRGEAVRAQGDRASAGRSRRLGEQLGGSGASLHAKTFAVDGKRAFVGTFNFDPRSAELNTEMGFVVDSPTLAGRIHKGIRGDRARGRLRGATGCGRRFAVGGPQRQRRAVYTTEPNTSLLKRVFARVLSWLPIDSML